MADIEYFSNSLQEINTFNLRLGLRHLVVFNGELDWSINYLHSIDEVRNILLNHNHKNDGCLIYSDNSKLPANVTSQNYRHKLGTQSQWVIYQDAQLHLDILCALAGTLVAGGVLFILLNEQEYIDNKSFFWQRLKNKVAENEVIWSIHQDSAMLTLSSKVSSNKACFESLPSYNHKNIVDFQFGAQTQEQETAILAVLNVAKGHRNRPLVLTADRGRGKSSALAIACAELIKSDACEKNIVVCAPHRHSLSVFFERLSYSLKEHSPELKGNKLLCGKSSVQFMPIDELIKQKIDTQLVLIDEAASIPVYLLTALAKKYSRLVFSTTVHGYEGAGRGFGLIFQKALKSISPEMQKLHIKEPIRWSIEDPLEGFIADLCLLDAQLPGLDIVKDKACSKDNIFQDYKFQRVTSYELMRSETLLHHVFAILVTAHYQTSPNDLKLLLDNAHVHTLVLSRNEEILGVALVMEEGGEIECDVQDLQIGKRRVKDQFLPQSLLSHLGIKESFSYRYHRVLRIAIHPSIQNQGLGTHFLEKIEAYSQSLEVDFLGASFGLSTQLLNFWLKRDFNMMRIGFSKDTASGEYSVMMMKALSNRSTTLQNQLMTDFYRQFTYLLSDEYAEISPEIVTYVLSTYMKDKLPILSDIDLRAVQDFALSYRQYSCCVLGLHHWLLHHIADMNLDDTLKREAAYPLVMRVFQKRSVSDISKLLGFTGKKALQSYMVAYIKKHFV